MSKPKAKLTEGEQNVFLELLLESDRGCVLSAHGFLDGRLEGLLREEFRPSKVEIDTEHWLNCLFSSGSMPPLQSFYVKAVMARALGMIDRGTFDSLFQLNRLRNHFGHNPGRVTLTEERVAVICDPLRPELKAYLNRAERLLLRGKENTHAARTRFVAVAYTLMFAFDLAMRAAESHQGLRGAPYEEIDMEAVLKRSLFDRVEKTLTKKERRQSRRKRKGGPDVNN